MNKIIRGFAKETKASACRALVCWLCLLRPGQVIASAPPNDELENAIRLTGTSISVETSTVDATSSLWELMASASSPGHGKRLWWVWQAPRNGVLALRVASPDGFANALVFPYRVDSTSSGPIGTIDGLPSFSDVSFEVSQGVDYWIAAGLENEAEGRLTLQLSFLEATTNGLFATRVPLPNGTVRTLINTVPFLLDRRTPSGEQGGAQWFSWTPERSGVHTFRISAVSGRRTFAPFLSVYVGDDFRTLEEVASSAVGPGFGRFVPLESQAFLDAVAGKSYSIAVKNPIHPVGSYPLELSIVSGTPPAVALLSPADGDTFDPRAPLSMAAQVGSHDAAIARVNFLVENDLGAIWSLVTTQRPYVAKMPVSELSATSHALLVRVEDVEGRVAWSSPAYVTPKLRTAVNDDFSNAIAMEGDFVRLSIPVEEATVQPLEPPLGSGATLWWGWRPAGAGPFCIRVRDVHHQSAPVEVYTGNSLSDLTRLDPVPLEDGSVFRVDAGQRYWIQAGVDHFRLGVSRTLEIFPTAVGLSMPAGPDVISGSPFSLTLDSRSMSGIRRLRLLAEDRGIVSFLAPPFAATIVLTNHLTSGLGIRMKLETEDLQGRKWTRWVSGPNVVAAPPGNDAFSAAYILPSSERVIAGNVLGATIENNETNRGGSLWWIWEPDHPGPYTLTPGERPFLEIEVFQGDSLEDIQPVGAKVTDRFTGKSITWFQAEPGRSYRLRVASFSRDPFRISIAPTAPPAISFLSPRDDVFEFFTNSMPIRVVVDSPTIAISEVLFLLGDRTIGRAGQPPYLLDWNFAAEGTEGIVSLSVIAVDAAGNRVESSRVSAVAFIEPPANASFARPQVLDAAAARAVGTTSGAYRDPDAPLLDPPLLGRTVWFEWTAPETRSFIVRVAAPDAGWNTSRRFQLALLRAIGTEFEALPLLVNQDPVGEGSHGEWKAIAGQRYRIAVSDTSLRGGAFEVQVLPGSLPSIRIVSPTAEWNQDSTQPLAVMMEALDPDAAPGTVELWIGRFSESPQRIGSWDRAPFVGQVTIPPLLTHEVPSARRELTARVRDDQGIWQWSESVWITVVRPSPSAQTDAFAHRGQLQGRLLRWTLPNARATTEPGEPHLDAETQRWGTLWWTWTPELSGVVHFSNSSGTVQIYGGTRLEQLELIHALPSEDNQLSSFPVRAGVPYQIRVMPWRAGEVRLLLDSRTATLTRTADHMIVGFDSTLESFWRADVSTDLEHWTPVFRGSTAEGGFQFNAPVEPGIPRLFHRIVLDPSVP